MAPFEGGSRTAAGVEQPTLKDQWGEKDGRFILAQKQKVTTLCRKTTGRNDEGRVPSLV